MRIENKAADGALIKFDGGLIKNVARAGHYPIMIMSGGVHFNRTVVVDGVPGYHGTHHRNWLEPGWRSPNNKVTNVEGFVTVYTSSGNCTDGFNASRGDEHRDLVVTCKKATDEAAHLNKAEK